MKDKFEGIIKSQKDRQYKDNKDNRTNDDLENTTQKTKYKHKKSNLIGIKYFKIQISKQLHALSLNLLQWCVPTSYK